MAELMASQAYCCFKCQNLVAFHDDIVSKDFQARQLITGLHTLVDVFCSDCGEELVWKYIKAYEETQKYKEGKCVLDKFKIIKSNG
ncbi:hypothetical protein AAZX31_16G020900 [Glycine max]